MLLLKFLNLVDPKVLTYQNHLENHLLSYHNRRLKLQVRINKNSTKFEALQACATGEHVKNSHAENRANRRRRRLRNRRRLAPASAGIRNEDKYNFKVIEFPRRDSARETRNVST